MSPPIRDGSGNSIGSIRLGDGSEISEVRTGAGDVLFSAAPPIPDSAVYQWKLDEGTGATTVNDSDPDDDGVTVDGTVDGADWVSSPDYVGGEALDFVAANNDTVNFDSTIVAQDPSKNSFSCAFTFNPDNTNNAAAWQQTTDGGFERLGIGVVNSEAFGAVRIDATSYAEVETSTGDISNQGLVRIVYTFDSSDNSGKIYLNGSDDTNSSSSGVNSITTVTNGFVLGAETDGTDSSIDAVIDNPIIYNKVLTPSEVQSDYDAQPIS